MPLLSKAHFPLQIDAASTRLYGLEILSLGEEEATARVAVRRRAPAAGRARPRRRLRLDRREPDLVRHLKAVSADGKRAQGLSNQTSFLRPIVRGTIHATARRRHSGRTTWVWEVDITDDEGRVCALVRMTVAVREAPPG